MGEIHPFPTEESRDRRSFEKYHRALLKGRGASPDAIDYAIDRFWPLYDELTRNCLYVRLPPECRETMREMRAHYDDLNARLVHEALVAFAEAFDAQS